MLDICIDYFSCQICHAANESNESIIHSCIKVRSLHNFWNHEIAWGGTVS
jgi:hypothetical protein